MNSVIKPLLLMEHNWIATIGPVQASMERAPRPGVDNEAGLVNETSGAHYQRSLPCLWLSKPWALEIGLWPAAQNIADSMLLYRKREDALASSPLSLQSMPQVNWIHFFPPIPKLRLFPCVFFSKEGSCTHTLSQEIFMDFVWGGLSGLHLELNQDLFSPFLPPPCLSFPPLNGS